MLRWIPGRQPGSYAKMALIPNWLSEYFNFDVWLLKFPSGCSVIHHKDPVKAGYRHFRMNITLVRPSKSESMYIQGPIYKWWRFEVFRPDLYFHGLNPISGKMYILSIGCRI